jgi:transketolase
MRNSFISALEELAETDENIYFITGDLGYSVIEGFQTKFPKRFLNAGIAEQNMTGMAAGLSSLGNVVFTYSIANFPIVRCLEQIRNDVCYHNLNVKIVAVGGGLAYASLGYSHHGMEDIAMTRVLPNLVVISPADPVEANLATRAIAKIDGPCYLRLGKANETVIHKEIPDFTIGKCIPIRKGDDIVIIGTGSILTEVIKAADQLNEKGLSIEVVSMHTISHIDIEYLESVRFRKLIVTVEEHGEGGLGAAVMEAYSKLDIQMRILSINLGKQIHSYAGTQDELRKIYGLDSNSIVESILKRYYLS